ncbi:uncharacterized protein E0L32_007224 [Thyridium curvatum]|uniref:Zn(2)-C6 fungal-type domain-containing protein n=1 Tax=Thyridium curvatum TaxID=1093900 RepID=A0A507B440_9PEZI|nr:uncharacterized protein E0L32_007224 [Thyridium curvatum]TPX12109.1 hypothetical protein E0L32_007224 [Thyridium curvatum]
MSSALSEIDVKTLPALDLDVSPHGGGPDTEADPAHHDPTSLDAFSMETPTDGLGPTTGAHGLMDASFGDFQFPYHGMDEEATIVALPDGNSPDLFGSHGHALDTLPDHSEAATSVAAHLNKFSDHQNDQRRESIDASEDGSPDSMNPGVNPLEEPLSDEFGLTHAPGDGTDLGGKTKEDKLDATPAWSELKTKAGKERKRLPLACIACRRKKIRCSGEKPACKHCLRSRIPCVYKVTARKAAPRTDYMAMLDRRLKRMEDRIIKIVPKAEQDNIASSVTRAVVKPAIPGTLVTGKSSTKKRGVDEAFGPDLDHWARAPAKNRLSTAGKPQTLITQESEESKLLQEGVEALPSKEIQEHLAEVYFENIYGQAYHILHKPSYMRKLRTGTLPPVLILSVCAISARFSTHPKLNTSPNFLRGEEWASHARDIVMRRYEWPNITILTCLLILGLHEFGTCHGGRSWALGGQAIRMAFALQLHKDLEYDPQPLSSRDPLSFVDREIRRRTMWACFLMDRFNSSGTDRPTFMKEETIKIPLPIKEKQFQLDMPGPTETLQGQVLFPGAADDDNLAVEAKENMGVAAYMIKAIAVWGRVINYLSQGGKELDPHPMWSPESGYSNLVKQTDEMLSTLPDTLTYTKDNLHQHDTDGMANQFLFLHIAIQQNILFMNRFAVSSPNGQSQQDVPKSFVTKAGAKAFGAANRISELLAEAESYLIAAPFVGYCAFLSSTVHIFGIFSGNPAMEATSKRNLATNVKFLSKMKRYWGMFHFMSENLREQYRSCADAARQGNNPASESAASPIFQYGDWFDRYPHGVSHSDFLDPAQYQKKERGDDAVLEQKPELHTVEEFFTTLSPRSAEGKDPSAARPAMPKRKPVVKKAASAAVARSETQQLDHLSQAGSEQHIQPQLRRRAYSTSLGGQTSGPTNFNPLTIPHSQTGTSYHALSPISPVAMNQFGHPSGPFYSPELMTLSLAHPANGLLPQLDRQLVFGAYAGMDPSSIGGGQSVLDGMGWDGMPEGAHAAAGGGRRANGSVSEGPQQAGGGGRAGAGPEGVDTLHPFGGGHHGQEASSAWFMPFNMDPPEIGQDTGPGLGNLDQFANMFGGAGMSTPGGGAGGMGGLHHTGGH